MLESLDIDEDFLGRTPVTQEMTLRLNKWDPMSWLLHSQGSYQQSEETT